VTKTAWASWRLTALRLRYDVDVTMSLALRLLDGVEEMVHTTSTPSTRRPRRSRVEEERSI